MEITAIRVYNGWVPWRGFWNQDPTKRVQFLTSERRNWNTKEVVMLRWSVGFFLVAILAALLGFSGIALASAGIAKILFVIFLLLFAVTLLGHLVRRT
jgi:uncharacterized membrane protein YtjA (UPF0391 family)